MIEDASLLLEDVTSSLSTKEILDELSGENVEGSKILDDSNVSSIIPLKAEPGGTLSVSHNSNPTQFNYHSSLQEIIQVSFLYFFFTTVVVL